MDLDHSEILGQMQSVAPACMTMVNLPCLLPQQRNINAVRFQPGHSWDEVFSSLICTARECDRPPEPDVGRTSRGWDANTCEPVMSFCNAQLPQSPSNNEFCPDQLPNSRCPSDSSPAAGTGCAVLPLAGERCSPTGPWLPASRSCDMIRPHQSRLPAQQPGRHPRAV